MKRSLLATVFIGAIAAAIVIALEKSGMLLRPESIIAQTVFRGPSPNEPVGLGNYLLLLGLGFAVAWAMLQITEVSRRGGLFLLLVAELLGAAWVLSRAVIFFQPIPALLVTILCTLLAACVTATRAGREARATATLFEGRLSQSSIDRLTESETPNLAEPKSHEVSLAFCAIANQADLIDELPAAVCTRLTRDFIECATALFLKEGGYLHAADGEGINVLFGFPNTTKNHATDASRAALAFRERFAALAVEKPESLGKIDLRIGINSGTVLATVPEDSRRREILIAGEPFELARRLALANQIYGSQILIGPRTFNVAGKGIVARPIDFLRSGEAHARLEIYELLALAEKATAEEFARRDRFWTGVVYFRERRWNEAFAEFNRARLENGESDEPLQWYLRRLEPLCLQMATEPAPVAEPLTPL